MSSSNLALQVCITCKARKRGCDKKLPACGYCTKRDLVCQYTPPSLADTSLHFLPIPPLATITNNSTLHSQVRQIIQATGQTIESTTFRSFRGTHSWLPIIHTRKFHRRLATIPVTSDISILLLAMCLLTYDPDPLTSRTPTKLVSQESLYLATKMLFTQVQASIPTSTILVQASVLISVYEFASGRLSNAYMSIGASIQMAYSIGLQHLNHAINNQSNDEEHSEAEERKNLWWGIVICERIIFLELNSPDQTLASTLPSPNAPLPSENGWTDGKKGPACNEPTITPPLSPPPGSISPFAWQAQAVSLLERLLNAFKLVDIQDLKPALSTLDIELQTFLSVVMDQCDGTGVLLCGSIAITIRSLFVLHWHILSQTPTTQAIEEWQQSSWAALDTVTKIMIDIAHSDNTSSIHSNIDALPPTILYSLLASQEHLNKSPYSYEHDDVWKRDFEALDNMAGHFKKRWRKEME